MLDIAKSIVSVSRLALPTLEVVDSVFLRSSFLLIMRFAKMEFEFPREDNLIDLRIRISIETSQ